MDSHSLFQDMRRLQGYNTRGAYGPCGFLLHPKDFKKVYDAVEDEEMRTGYGFPLLQFNGIPVLESALAEEGKPLVMMKG